ncbi:hypothetical protein Tco_0534756 [Tanacetum coccineum]
MGEQVKMHFSIDVVDEALLNETGDNFKTIDQVDFILVLQLQYEGFGERKHYGGDWLANYFMRSGSILKACIGKLRFNRALIALLKKSRQLIFEWDECVFKLLAASGL